jgi:hypothetical protein
MDERASGRVVIDSEVEAVVGTAAFRVLLYDLSTDGCMIDTGGAPLPEAGAAIDLALPLAGAKKGHLVWTRGRFGGVRFLDRLPEAIVLHLGFRPHGDEPEAFQDRFGRPLPQLRSPSTFAPNR